MTGAEKPQDVDQLIGAAVDTARAGNTAAAIRQLENLLADHPQHTGALGHLAYLYHLEERLDDEIGCYEKISRLDPNLALARFKLGDAYWAKGDKKKARRAYASLQGSELFEREEVRRRLAQTENLLRKIARRLFPVLKQVAARMGDSQFRRALVHEMADLPGSIPEIGETGFSSYLSYLSRHFLRGESFRNPSDPCDLCGDAKRRAVFFHREHKVVKCRTCGLERVERKPVEGMDVATDHYEQESTIRFFETMGWRDPKAHRQRLDLLRSLFQEAGVSFPQPDAAAFEIGLGQGYFLKELERLGYRVSGAETSGRLVEHAKNELGIEAVQATIASLEEDKKYDLVMAYHVLEHLDRPSQLFEKARRLLPPGGCLVIESPTADLSRMPLSKKLDDMIGYANMNHMHFFTGEHIRKYFEKHGFELSGTYELYSETHPTGGFLGKRG